MDNRALVGRVDGLMKMPALSRNLFLALSFSGMGLCSQDLISLETGSFILCLNKDGRTVCFVDRASGKDYFDDANPTAFAEIRGGTGTFHSQTAEYDGEFLTVGFGASAGQVVFRIESRDRCLVIEVLSVSWEGAEELTFAAVPLALKGTFAEAFAVSPLALNLQTNCHQIPGVSSSLSGFIAYRRFGFAGARGAIIAAPPSELRDALKAAVQAAPDLVVSPRGGPWALDATLNQGSYLIDVAGTINEENVEEWIEAAEKIGATQIDFHGGRGFRWGDLELNRDVYPRGRESLRAVVDAIHDAGMAAGLHTYAFFIAKDTPWVTPIPNPDLDIDSTFTLAADLSEADDLLPVEETTESMSAITGFQVRNSVTLRIGDELITFSAIDKHPPYAFRGCVRGAYGTTPAHHARGARVSHVKECFGLFVPRGDSTLFAEVAQRTADLYNECGFDMLYLDALDGSDILDGWKNAWHYAASFTYELARRLDKPAVMEMSTFTHHLWCVRSRMQAWDCPMRGFKQFVDGHVFHNQQWELAFFPTHLGWWGIFDWNGIQPERSMLDDFEYLCVKALATGSSISYVAGVTPETLRRGNVGRFAAMARRYEDLRRAGTVPKSVREALAKPGTEYTLEMEEEEDWRFRPVTYSKQTFGARQGESDWVVHNPYGPQPLRLRIEALLSVANPTSPENRVLVDWADIESLEADTQQGVKASLESAGEVPGSSEEAVVLVAQNDSAEKGCAWATFRHEFEEPLDLKKTGLGLWVEGDGQAAVLNLQLQSPKHLGGGFTDRYLNLDFTGWRYVELIETESDALSDYEWRHTRRRKDWSAETIQSLMRFFYPMYHIWVDYSQISSLTLGINNLPVGKTVRVGLGFVQAIPLCAEKLTNPSVTLGGETLTFPVELESGSFLEFQTMDDCRVYDSKGEDLGAVIPAGEIPLLRSGENMFHFENEGQDRSPGRARVTVMMQGKPLNPLD